VDEAAKHAVLTLRTSVRQNEGTPPNRMAMEEYIALGAQARGARAHAAPSAPQLQ
jgi:hypothetical protein